MGLHYLSNFKNIQDNKKNYLILMIKKFTCLVWAILPRVLPWIQSNHLLCLRHLWVGRGHTKKARWPSTGKKIWLTDKHFNSVMFSRGDDSLTSSLRCRLQLHLCLCCCAVCCTSVVVLFPNHSWYEAKGRSYTGYFHGYHGDYLTAYKQKCSDSLDKSALFHFYTEFRITGKITLLTYLLTICRTSCYDNNPGLIWAIQ